MIQSMTGFTEKKAESPTLALVISIRTLNHRFFDWSFRGNQVKELENNLRAVCQKKLHRGRIEVTVDLKFTDQKRWELDINEELLIKLMKAVGKVSSKSSSDVTFSVENLFAVPNIVEMKRKSFKKEEILFLEKIFSDTLDELIKIRTREGRQLGRQIRSHAANITKFVRFVEKQAKKQPALIQNKFKEKLVELGSGTPLTEEKILEEAAFFAQRYDITEEISRLKCHLDYVQELLTMETEEPVGKKLDFMAQELFREANTINSKAQDIEIIKECLKIKNEVEAIRQQVQNIE
jgi:uncharacterized protein (TIGR00255 family)